MDIPNPPISGQSWKTAVLNWIGKTAIYLRRSRILPDNHTIFAKYSPDGMILSTVSPKSHANLASAYSASRTGLVVKAISSEEVDGTSGEYYITVTGGKIRYKGYSFNVTGYADSLSLQAGETLYVFIVKMIGKNYPVNSNVDFTSIIHFQIRCSKCSSFPDAIKIGHITKSSGSEPPKAYSDDFDYGPDGSVVFHDFSGAANAQFIPELCYYDADEDIDSYSHSLLEDCTQKVAVPGGIVYVNGQRSRQCYDMAVALPTDDSTTELYVYLKFTVDYGLYTYFAECAAGRGENITIQHYQNTDVFPFILATFSAVTRQDSDGNSKSIWSVYRNVYCGGAVWLNVNNHPVNLHNKSFTLQYNRTTGKLLVKGGYVLCNEGTTLQQFFAVEDKEFSVSNNSDYYVYIYYNRNMDDGTFSNIELSMERYAPNYIDTRCVIAHFHSGNGYDVLPSFNEFYAGQAVRLVNMQWEDTKIRSCLSSIDSLRNQITELRNRINS